MNQLGPRNHTSGYCLHRDHLQRQSRYIEFDYVVLCGGGTQVLPGANFVARCEKIDGGFNRVFRMTSDGLFARKLRQIK